MNRSRRPSATSRGRARHRAFRARTARRGGALLLMLFLSMSIAALAISAIFLSSSSRLLTTQLDREEIDSYAADAALALGKSRLNQDPTALPDTGWTYVIHNGTIPDASNNPLPGLSVNVYVGPTGSIDQQTGGRFATLFAEVTDVNGGKTIRRLEMVQETFREIWLLVERGGLPDKSASDPSDNIYGPRLLQRYDLDVQRAVGDLSRQRVHAASS